MNKFKNILIVRTDRLGDVVLTLPLAEIIKEKYPEAKVTYLLNEYTIGLAFNHPYIDETLVFTDRNGNGNFKRQLRLIKNKFFDCVIIVHPTFRLAILTFLAGIKCRVGTGFRWYSFLFNRKLFEHRKTAKKHELEYNVSLLKTIGIEKKISTATINFSLQVDSKSKQKVIGYLEKKGFNDNLPSIIIHPGSGSSAADLPIPKFKELLTHLVRELKVNFILTGSKSEMEICKQLEITGNTINTAGKFNLKELIALISLTDLIIANSTGPLHIAAALGKHVIAFYPKAKECSQERWGPYTDKAFVFLPDTDCVNCSCKECRMKNCMSTIKILPVVEAAKEIIYNVQIK